MAGDNPPSAFRTAWAAALMGLGLFVFALVALSGPGRIDVVDGQTRFEVGRSLVEHGDSVLRDDRIWWGSFPGRNEHFFTYYRFPQSLAAVGAIVFADATGPIGEGRRHFFYVLCGAVSCGMLSILYALWFRKMGCRPFAAILWGCGGIVCTPMWFYGTSTYDEYLGTTVLIAGLVAALSRKRLDGAILAGLLFGLAYNVKQPLGAFVILALALHDDRHSSNRQRLLRAAIILAGLAVGILAEQSYDRYKFPFDKNEAHADLLKLYGPNFANHQLEAIVVLSVSLGGGAIWYFPPVLLSLAGILARWKDDRRVVLALSIAALAFLGFFISLSFFKGDPSWGPRYLTPLFGVLWLFAPAGAAKLRKPFAALLLGVGIVLQILGLSVDPHRLYVERDASSGFGRVYPMLYFNPALSHLANRPREIVDIARAIEPAEEYTPAPSPTFAFPVLDPPYLEKRGPDVVKRFRVLNSFRPWWTSMTFLPADDRPVNLGKTAAIFLWIASAGLILLGLAVKRIEVE